MRIYADTVCLVKTQFQHLTDSLSNKIRRADTVARWLAHEANCDRRLRSRDRMSNLSHTMVLRGNRSPYFPTWGAARGFDASMFFFASARAAALVMSLS